MKKFFEVLRENPLFFGVEEENLEAMLQCLSATIRTYQRGSFLRQEGDSSDFIGIVLEGTLQILQDDYHGNRHITSVVSAGHIFGEAFPCAGIATIPVSVFVATDSTVLLLNAKKVLQPCCANCQFHNQIIQNLLMIVSKKNVQLNRKLNYLSQKTTSEKIMAFLKDQEKLNHASKFTIPYNRQALADYLGVERSALSAEISKLQKQGKLITNRNYFELL